MTLNEFLTHLAQTSRTWTLQDARLRQTSWPYENLHCPISAVADALGLSTFGPRHYAYGASFVYVLATRLSLDPVLMHTLIDASDSPTCHTPGLRRALLEACDLPEEA